MWVPKAVADWFKISKQHVDLLHEELAALKVERDILKTELISTKANFEWLRLRVNVLEVERAQLLEKAYGIKTVVPEIVRTHTGSVEMNSDLFEDMGDDRAKALGLPVYGLNQN